MWEAIDRPLPVYIASQDAPLVAPWEGATLRDLVGTQADYALANPR